MVIFFSVAVLMLFFAVKSIHNHVALKRFEKMLLAHVENQHHTLDTQYRQMKKVLQKM